MNKVRVIVISSVLPAQTTAGQIILYRHLCSSDGLKVEVFGDEPTLKSFSALLRRAVGLIGKAGFPGLAESFWALWGGRWLDATLPHVDCGERAVVLTVAHGDGFGAAIRFARSRKLPLVAIFHDWWPDMPPVHPWVQRCLERRFRDLYAASSSALCVSEEMRKFLGNHPNSEVLYPIPEKPTSPVENTTTKGVSVRHGPLRILYAGNLQAYGAMLGAALQSLLNHPQLRCEVRGAEPEWSTELRERMRSEGCWLPFAPRPEVQHWLSTADAFLIPMEFDPRLRRRMETSFPSKITDFASFGKPLVIWGPAYCSAVRWASQDESALCVTDPNPEALRAALESLVASSAEYTRLAAKAARAYEVEFDHECIQAQFIGALRRVIKR
jgi:glycosyltransferase involved in cell wall biosynthesis